MEHSTAAKQLSYYADHGNIKGARRLLQNIAGGNTVPYLHYYNTHKFYRNALMLASENGNDSVVRLLIQEGVDVNRVDRIGCTASMLAARNGHCDILDTLIDAGAEINHKDGIYKETCLTLAAEGGHYDTTVLLMKNKACLDAMGKYAMTALSAASTAGHDDIVQLLLSGGATDDRANDDDEDATHDR